MTGGELMSECQMGLLGEWVMGLCGGEVVGVGVEREVRGVVVGGFFCAWRDVGERLRWRLRGVGLRGR